MIQSLTLEKLEQLCKNHPDSLAFAHLAAKYLEVKEYDKALEICKKGIPKHPEYAFGRYILGLTYYYLKNYDEAKKELEVALALDPAIPQGWKIIGSISEQMKLTLQSKENYLHYYLTDYFSNEAANSFYKKEAVEMELSESDLGKRKDVPETEEEIVEKTTDGEIDQLFKITETTKEADEFDKTLDEVFKETTPSISRGTEDDFKNELAEEEFSEEVTEKITESEESDTGSDDEFTEAMESFFKDYEKSGKEAEVKTPESEEETEKKEDITAETELELEGTFTPSEEEIVGEKEEAAQEEVEPEFPEDFIEEEEPLDFSTVVADIISERNEEFTSFDESKKGEELKEVEESDDQFKGEKAERETEQETKKDQEDVIQTEQLTQDETKEETTHFGRPPILSPTLGEIYIAQGRFEEAIDIFRQLLDKDPENSRYRRKIADLEEILKKQKSRQSEK